MEGDSHRGASEAAAREPLAAALDAVGDRWTLLVIAALLDGPRRFGELEQRVAGIAPNVLTQRLRRLERDALVIARPYSERPPRFEYELTAAGAELSDVLRLLGVWGARASGREGRGGGLPMHPVCGTPLQVRWWCPTCQTIAGDSDHEELHFA
jgi:DNA-binding HxlR family transcriptional regulator